ncbi:MAG: two-component system, unclassified family, response regulator [Oceanicaulis sp. HLUCCA04]|nr:MAG: two-component system, unclassified family, response regulator [Oceanicaulis sp. HLUCCA04]
MAKNIRLLLVEDDESDAFLTKRAFAEMKGTNLMHVPGGQAALDALRSSRFDILLLDLNMPGLSGHEVIHALRDRQDPELVPVIVFSSSNQPGDVDRAYEAGANAYLRKPDSLGGYQQVADAVCRFWRDNAEFPGRH